MKANRYFVICSLFLLPKKLQSQTVIREKLQKHFFTKKQNEKKPAGRMLVKLTPPTFYKQLLRQYSFAKKIKAKL